MATLEDPYDDLKNIPKEVLSATAEIYDTLHYYELDNKAVMAIASGMLFSIMRANELEPNEVADWVQKKLESANSKVNQVSN